MRYPRSIPSGNGSRIFLLETRAAASFFRIPGYLIMDRNRQNGFQAGAGYYEEEKIWHVFWYLQVKL